MLRLLLRRGENAIAACFQLSGDQITGKSYMLSDFKPPKPNAAILAFCRWIYPLFMRYSARLSIHFNSKSLALLQSLTKRRVVFIFNHPDRLDPLVLGALDQNLRHPFYCIVAREVFDWNRGLRGFLFQRVGCYSVNRGTTDLQSIRTTNKILHERNAKLIVFPEGKITCDNSNVHELQRSFMHILLAVQSELTSKHEEEPIVLVPVATRYELETDLESSLHQLKAIERKLKIQTDVHADVYTRIDKALESAVNQLAEVYGLGSQLNLPTVRKMELLTNHICQRISTYLNAESHACDAHDCHLYHIRAIVSQKIDDIKAASAYQQSVCSGLQTIYKQFLLDLDRVERLLICHGNLERPRTPIQACRTADFLEYELFGKMTAKGQQRAWLNIGQPVELSSYLELYSQSRSAAVEKLTLDARHQLQEALDDTMPKQKCEANTTLK